jgi:hypothetical protein
MTVPEENRPEAETTDEMIAEAGKTTGEGGGRGAPGHGGYQEASGRSMQEALDEAGIKPEDYEE